MYFNISLQLQLIQLQLSLFSFFQSATRIEIISQLLVATKEPNNEAVLKDIPISCFKRISLNR